MTLPCLAAPPQVESAQLLVFVGGEEAVYEDARTICYERDEQSQLLSGSCRRRIAYEISHEYALGIWGRLRTLAEALLLGQRMGLGKEKMIAVLNDTAVVSPSQKIKMQNALADEYPVAFSLANMYKDFGLILEQAHTHHAPMPATAAAQQVSAIGMARKVDADFAVVIQLLDKITSSTKI